MYKVRYVGHLDNELVSDERIEAAGEVSAVGIYDADGNWIGDYSLIAIDIVKEIVVLLNNGILTEEEFILMLEKFEKN